jgi:hypothetical protein
MLDSFEPAYAYARICGSLARSFFGERASALASSARVAEAWRTIFADAPPALPESRLADAAERSIGARATLALRRLAGPLAETDPFIAALARKREFALLKATLCAAAEGAEATPEPALPGLPAPAFDAEAYPDLGGMLRGTRYQWIIEKGLGDVPALKNGLDRQYYSELWGSLGEIPARLAGGCAQLVRVEAELVNLAWALRLSSYYSMGADEIAELLIELGGIDVHGAALDALRRRRDSRQEWEGWKWERLLPARSDSGTWRLDVRALESAARRYLFRLLYRRLHLEQDSYLPLYAYFRLKEEEALALHGIVEGIKLEAPAAEIASFAVETTGGAA